MRIPSLISISLISLAAVAVLSRPLASSQSSVPLYQRFLSPASPQELVAARHADRVAWVDYAEGKRNAYAASAPLFAPVRLTNFQKDDGIMMSAIRISDDGGTVVFLRGEAPNKADVTKGEAEETWHNQPDDLIAANVANPRPAGYGEQIETPQESERLTGSWQHFALHTGGGLFPRYIEFVILLQPEPQFRRSAEIPRQTQRHGRADPAFLVDDVRHMVRRYVQSPGQCVPR
jgi:hypothetical protein